MNAAHPASSCAGSTRASRDDVPGIITVAPLDARLEAGMTSGGPDRVVLAPS
jgi:hypothetical protein